MSTLPEVGSTVYAVLGTPGVSVVPLRVLSAFPNAEGVVGAWFTVEDAWQDRGLALSDEGISWTRSSDPEAHRALLAAYGLYIST